MPYLVGVDSGGTHTNIRVETPNGKKARVEIDRALGGDRSSDELRAVSTEIFSAIQAYTMGEPACVWINAAGYSAASKDRLEDLLAAAVIDLNMRMGISNDGVSLLLAHDSELVAIIAGTGSLAMARNSAGEVITRGGDEWVVADYGSAFWLGLNGIRAAYRALEGGPDTALLNSLLEHFTPLRDNDAKREARIVVRQIAWTLARLGTSTKPIIASFAPAVTRLAEVGDDEAQKIVRHAVDDLAGAAARVYRELAAKAEGRVVAPRFLLSGSVGYRSPFYLEAFQASLNQFLFDVRENTGRTIDLVCQLNGLSEALTLARYLAEEKTIPKLDDQHPFYIQSSANYRPSYVRGSAAQAFALTATETRSQSSDTPTAELLRSHEPLLARTGTRSNLDPGTATAVADLAAFMSYVRFDDQHNDGRITRFRERLGREVRAQTGEEFTIFQDRNDIAWGQNWQRRINEALDEASLLLVIITPSLFRSGACRAEVNRFLERERALDRQDLILPVYYISAREMEDPRRQDADEMAQALASRQYADWRELRLKPFASPQVHKAISQLAARMRDTFWHRL